MIKFVLLFVLIQIVACSPGKWSVTEENDYFTFFNKDNGYTQGLLIEKELETNRVGFGQRIYTPEHKRVAEPLPDERPYAGYLYGKIGKLDQTDFATRYVYEGEFGLVGPHAYGEEVQCGVHKLLGQRCPEGWHNQLKDEPTFTLRAALEKADPRRFLFTNGVLLTRAMIEVGNLSDKVQFDSIMLFHLADWISLYAGPRIHFVARNLLLDGNTFRDSQSVDTNWYYTEMTGALEFKIKNTKIKWQLVVESPQFKEQSSSYNWGGVTVSWEL